MPQPCKTLPPGYQHCGTLDLARNKKLLIVLNLVGLIAFIVFGLVFWRLAAWLQPTVTMMLTLDGLVAVLVGSVVTIVLHELIHGLGFWLFTRDRPTFGFKGLYAYAGAPAWYLPRNQHVVVGLAPLVLISLAGLLLVPLVPPTLVGALVLLLTLNAAGAIGDLVVVAWLLTRSAMTLVRDTGDTFSLFAPAARASEMQR